MEEAEEGRRGGRGRNVMGGEEEEKEEQERERDPAQRIHELLSLAAS